MTKVRDDARSALDGLLFNGMSIIFGGIGLCGIPENPIDALTGTGGHHAAMIGNPIVGLLCKSQQEPEIHNDQNAVGLAHVVPDRTRSMNSDNEDEGA
jgi:hypothetical protein